MLAYAEYVRQLNNASFMVNVISTALQFDLFNKSIEKGPLSSSDLAEAAGIKLKRADEFFNSLVCMKFLYRDAENKYSATDLSKQIFSKDCPLTNFSFYW